MIEINGKVYPLWSQFVINKNDWIGGVLIDYGDSMDRSMGTKVYETEIIDIELKPNGDDSAWFGVVGKDFTCGFDVKYGGVSGFDSDDDYLAFRGYMGHLWKIRKK